MNHPLPIIVTSLITAVVGGCGESPTRDGRRQSPDSERRLDNATMRAGLDPTDDRIVAFVSWLRREGVTLESQGSGWWRLTQPRTPEKYQVVFSIRSFPEWASEQQMRTALDINLAYILNAPAHLAMSYGSTNAATPDAHPTSDDELPKLNGLPVTQAIQKLFKEY
jgi:hypothetical protein